MAELYVAGIDGGGTKTAAVILDQHGRTLGFGEGGPSTYGIVSDAVLRASLREAVSAARQAAGLPAQPFAAVFLGLGNVVSEIDRAGVRAAADDLGLAPVERIGVDHDCRVALAGGLSGRPGIVLIAGTGTSCFGINARGDSWRSGGWGPLIDDLGSSYWLGIQALRAVVLDYDGRGAPTALRERVAEKLGLADLNGLMNRLYAAGMSRTEIAALAPLVFETARAGDRAAGELIRAGCAAMAESVLAVARRLAMDAPELAVVGGLTNAGDDFYAPLAEEVRARLPECRITPAELPPAFGAGILALELSGKQVDAAVIVEMQKEAGKVGDLTPRPPSRSGKGGPDCFVD